MIFASNSSSFTTSSSLSIYLQINLHYVSTYSTTSIYGVQYCRYCTVTVFLSTVSTYIFFSLSTCQQCSYIFCVYLSTDLSHCLYAVYNVSIFLHVSFIYSTAPIYLQCKAFFSVFDLLTAGYPFAPSLIAAIMPILRSRKLHHTVLHTPPPLSRHVLSWVL